MLTPLTMKSKFLSPRFIASALIPVALGVGIVVLRGDGHPFRPVEPLPAAKFVDMHCHAAGIGAGGSGCFLSAELNDSFKLSFYLRGFGVTEAELREHGDALVIDRLSERIAASRNISHGVVLALDGAVDERGELDRARTEMYVPNEFVAAEVAKHSNLLFGASVNPYRRDAIERLEWAKAHGAVLVKWLPSIQHIDPSDARLVPFYAKLVELQLPLLTHTGSEHSFTRAEDALCDPERLRLPLAQGVTIIAAHAATVGRYEGEPALDRLGRLMKTYPNLYADVSSLTQINKHSHLGRVFDRPEMRDRLVYGTDYPLINIRPLVTPWYYPFRLSWAQRRTMSGYDNAWDRDVALKQALGLPADVWTRADHVLQVKETKS